ncbi:TPA: hypothetical protein HA278_03030 [Candidatus Woesearchaeota archaeon]|nr:hypothetical protein [archaeon]HIJ11008.1 hypothetical protein [Candidatus Woesearchaeota archaeon]
MKHHTKQALQQKGWSEDDIKKAESILDRSTKHDQKMSKIVFWSAMLVVVFGNILVTAALIPFLGVFPPMILYATIGILGLLIGFVYNFLIHDIAHLQKKHHIIGGILVPVLAVANILLMLIISAQYLPPEVPYNPFITSGVFIVPFLLPYIISRIRSKDPITG